jgi:hypothetical protein
MRGWRNRLKRRLPGLAVAAAAGARRATRDRMRAETPTARLADFVLREAYPGLVAPRSDALAAHEMRWSSQNGEDGIVLHLFSRLGVKAGCTFVEIGAGDGRECNSAVLALHFGWRGLLMDGDSGHVDTARRYYQRRLGPEADRVSVTGAFVTAENVNKLLAGHGWHGEIDLLGIDIDGVDYWIWAALDQVSPRVVVIEFNAGLGAERSAVVPYRPDFDRFADDPTGCFFGASLGALTQLGAAKGYVLAGCDSTGTNAFFVRADEAEGTIFAVSPVEAFDSVAGWPAAVPALGGYMDV